jgi:hypothetical protein
MTYTPNHPSGYTVGERQAVAGFQGEPDARVTVLGFHDDTTAIVRFDSADIGRDIARGEVHTVSTFYLVPRN